MTDLPVSDEDADEGPYTYVSDIYVDGMSWAVTTAEGDRIAYTETEAMAEALVAWLNDRRTGQATPAELSRPVERGDLRAMILPEPGGTRYAVHLYVRSGDRFYYEGAYLAITPEDAVIFRDAWLAGNTPTPTAARGPVTSIKVWEMLSRLHDTVKASEQIKDVYERARIVHRVEREFLTAAAGVAPSLIFHVARELVDVRTLRRIQWLLRERTENVGNAQAGGPVVPST